MILLTLLIVSCDTKRPSLIELAEPVTLDPPSISTPLTDLGNYGKQTAEGYVLKAPANFHLPTGTMLQMHCMNRNCLDRETPRLAFVLATDLTFTETWNSDEDVTIRFGRYIRDPYRLKIGGKNESVAGEWVKNFQADYHLDEHGNWSASNLKAVSTASQDAIVRSCGVVLGYDQIAATIGPDMKPRRVGDEWNSDMSRLKGPLAQLSGLIGPMLGELGIDLDKLKAVARFDRIEECRGVRCAVLVTTIEGPLAMSGERYKFKSSSTLWVSLEIPLCIASKSDSSVTTIGSKPHVISETSSSCDASYLVP